MKLRIQTLTGQIGEVEVNPQDTILDLKVSVLFCRGNWTVNRKPRYKNVCRI